MRYKLEITWTARIVKALGFRRKRISTRQHTAAYVGKSATRS
ncbi:hypothetical protein P4C99_03050 [Pontiellaceae bacterium B1224]|nr:hypothetical protein [Pontiellaceae bacterium B1224]